MLICCYFWRSWVRASQTYFQVQPTRCNVTQFIYFCEMLCMFQAVPPPIIKSSNCIYSIGYFVKTLLLPAGSSKGLTKYPMLYTQFLSSWCWAEEPPETCRTFHRIKYINCVTLHLVGHTWKYYCYFFMIWLLKISDPHTFVTRGVWLWRFSRVIVSKLPKIVGVHCSMPSFW